MREIRVPLMRYLVCMIFLSSSINISAQDVEGHITDEKGVSISAASIFIEEINQGLISDKNGRFQISLPQGTYTLKCIKPEYRDTTYIAFITGSNKLSYNLRMKRDSLVIEDVILSQSSNIADIIIKNCIEKAQGTHSRIKYYRAEVYINGRLVPYSVSKITDKILYKLDKIHVSQLKKQIISQESFTTLEYHFPDIYENNINTNLGYIPDFFTDRGAINILKGSIYSPRFNGAISPLNHNAFAFYKFQYEGYYFTQGEKCLKIKFGSRINDPDLFSGYLYILDKTWSIKHVVLKNSSNGMTSTLLISYSNLYKNIDFPTSFHSNIDFDIMGTTGNVSFYAGLRYKYLTSDSINNKQDYNNETMLDANGKDDHYWNKLRLQPLNNDSSTFILDIIDFRKDKIKFSKYFIAKLLIGGYINGNDSSTVSFKYNGVKMILRDYNYVDGFWIGNTFSLNMKFKNNANIVAKPYLYYTTARKRMLWGNETTYNYNLKKKGEFTIKFGSRTEDFNNLSLTRYQNYFNSLIIGENHNFFYQRDYFTLNNDIHLNTKIKFSTLIGIERRHGVSNHTDFSLLGRNNIKPNILSKERSDRTYYSIDLFYSPRSNYSITEALEMDKNDITPVFNIEYEEGLSSWQINNSKYRKIKGGLSHNIKVDYFNSIDYKVEAGTFISAHENMFFSDYQHFGASDMLLNLNSLFDSFLLLDNYELQTNRYWFNVFLNYSGKYVILKYIPFLQGKPFSENLHFKILFTPDRKSYIETGYSISFTRFFGIGTFMSFHNVQGQKFGTILSLNLRSLNFI